MQILQNVNINWLGMTRWFLLGSLLLVIAGSVAMYQDGGPIYGIDFRGGTVVYVRFAERAPIDEIRAALAAEGLGNSVIQRIGDPTDREANEVSITIEQVGSEDESLDKGKDMILTALGKRFGTKAEPGKQDFNGASAEALAAFLTTRDPMGLGLSANVQYQELAEAITDFRDSERSGLLATFQDLGQVTGVTAAVTGALQQGYYLSDFAVRNTEIVGPRVGAQLRKQAVLATTYALIGMLVYIAFRFEWVYGAAAVLAVIHDVLITLGFFAIFNYEISLTVIAAMLTLVGYSMNDTIVIFDRMRENLKISRREPLAVVANRAINQTLSRTALTSGLTFLTVLVLFLFGGEVLRSFSFALVIGIMVGTYSSIGIAAALVVAWDQRKGSRSAGASSASGASRRAPKEDSERQFAAAGRR